MSASTLGTRKEEPRLQAYLTMQSDNPSGARYALSAERDTRLGRGLDCDIVVDDPLSSRVHAIVNAREGVWWIRDAKSRNGTFVNGHKIDEAQLSDGATVKIGSIEFRFSGGSPVSGSETEETIVRRGPVDPTDTCISKGFGASPELRRFGQLFQYSVRLLSSEDPAEVISESLHLMQQVSQAAVVSFWWIDDEGQLKPHSVLPATVAHPKLSSRLTDLVCRQGEAVWIDERDNQDLDHFSTVMCAPLLHQGKVLGALHTYRKQGQFTGEHYDFLINAANVMVMALVRTQRNAVLHEDHQRLIRASAYFDELIGESRPMVELKHKIQRIAKASGCVLIRGESGVGKELVARALHRSGPRADRPLLSVNCAAIPRDLMESQLFGHRKGAFTGADSDHEGFFKRADAGTLFLDEVGEMTLEGQAKLLRILEGHPFLPVGGSQEITVDVRVIAATNRDLSEFVAEGRFREDLYYRLSVFELQAPPLRERGDDVGRLIEFFLEHFRLQHGRPHLTLAPEALRRLVEYPWPGNVRQLRNVIDSAVVLAEGEQIQPGDLGLREATAPEAEIDHDDSLSLTHWEEKLIRRALERTGNRVPEAARLLGIGRATLYRKLEEYHIER